MGQLSIVSCLAARLSLCADDCIIARMTSAFILQLPAFLFDLDGVFYNDTQPIPGGAEVITRLREQGVPFRFVTNTTSKGRVSLAAKLRGFGIAAEPREIVCPAVAA